jgi:nicotinic acetylcholine receptor
MLVAPDIFNKPQRCKIVAPNTNLPSSFCSNLGYFVGDGVWVVRGFHVERLVETYVETISSLIYTLQLRRKPLYYIYNLILPCVFITLCGLLVFLLPPDCGEKISMAVTMLLSATVFLVVFSESMPVQSDVIPAIGKKQLGAYSKM